MKGDQGIAKFLTMKSGSHPHACADTDYDNSKSARFTAYDSFT